MSDHPGVRIDNLQPTINPSANARLPVMHDGQTFYYTVQQVNSFLRAGVHADLDNLSKLSAAINDDPDFAATVAQAIGRRLAASENLADLQNPATARANLGVGYADSAAQAAFRANIGVDVLGGFRNKLINALGTINQRGYTSGAATSGANQYTVDRWRVVTSGQNLSWTESEGVRTFTAPAGGVEQVVEGGAILSGDYVLNWEGTASATVNGTPRAKGEVFSLTGGADVTVRLSGGNFSLPQLERGTSPTTFEPRHPQQELALCQRYYWHSGGTGVNGQRRAYNASGLDAAVEVDFPVFMRAAPTVSYTASAGSVNNTTFTNRFLSFRGSVSGGAPITRLVIEEITADAEL